MPTESSARSEILGRVRAALGRSGEIEPDAVSAEWNAIAREYRRSATLSHDEILEQLEDRLRDYDAHVERVRPDQVSEAIGRLLSSRSKRRILVPEGFSEVLAAEFRQSLPEGFEFVTDSGLTSAEMDALEGVITTAQVGISFTGTLVLQVVPGQGRRAATLIPDYHLCVLQQSDVVETVPEAMDRLGETASLATTFISGPSATADIEMTRIKGVHGPRFLDVLLVG